MQRETCEVATFSYNKEELRELYYQLPEDSKFRDIFRRGYKNIFGEDLN